MPHGRGTPVASTSASADPLLVPSPPLRDGVDGGPDGDGNFGGGPSGSGGGGPNVTHRPARASSPASPARRSAAGWSERGGGGESRGPA